MNSAQRKIAQDERIASEICDKVMEMIDEWELNIDNDTALNQAIHNASMLLGVEDQTNKEVVELAFEYVREE